MRIPIESFSRRVVESYNAKPYRLSSNNPVVSFTFDDIPRSAITNGADMLLQNGMSGTFYLSGSLVNKADQNTELYRTDDIGNLLDGGHEIGCHTFSHCDIRYLDSLLLSEELDQNANFIQEHLNERALVSFSYPFGACSIVGKNIVRKRFASARGIRPGVNVGVSDLSHIKANALYEHQQSKGTILKLLENVIHNNGWLVFYTHDVTENPTRYGCTPELLDFAITQSLDKGAEVLNMRAALARKIFQ